VAAARSVMVAAPMLGSSPAASSSESGSLTGTAFAGRCPGLSGHSLACRSEVFPSCCQDLVDLVDPSVLRRDLEFLVVSSFD
jgi:hypothetical protein